VHGHARQPAPRVDLLAGVPRVVGIAVHGDRHPGRPGDIDGLGGALFRAQPAGEHGARSSIPRPADGLRRHVRRQDRVYGHDPPPGAGLERGHTGDGPRLAAPGRAAQRVRDGRVRRQVQRVHHRRGQFGGERDGGRVERVIVHHVVAGLPDQGVHAGERGRGRVLVPDGRSRGPVERGHQRPRIDPGVDDRDPRYLGSGGRVHVDLVAPAGQPAREIGDERLRAAGLRLADRRHERRDERDPHLGMTLNEMSRGGLIPSSS
jgi:hypothetical protein